VVSRPLRRVRGQVALTPNPEFNQAGQKLVAVTHGAGSQPAAETLGESRGRKKGILRFASKARARETLTSLLG